MPTSARLEVANSPQITVKTVQSAGSMWASTPTPKRAVHCVCAAAFRKISCTLPGGQRRPPIRSRDDIDRDRTFLTRCEGRRFLSALHLFLWSCSLREDKILRSRKYHTDCFYVCNRFVRHQPRHCLLDDRLVFRINDDCEEGSDAQRAVRVEQPSERQNREHLRRKEGVSHRHAKLAAAHPVEIILRVRPRTFSASRA